MKAQRIEPNSLAMIIKSHKFLLTGDASSPTCVESQECFQCILTCAEVLETAQEYDRIANNLKADAFLFSRDRQTALLESNYVSLRHTHPEIELRRGKWDVNVAAFALLAFESKKIAESGTFQTELFLRELRFQAVHSALNGSRTRFSRPFAKLLTENSDHRILLNPTREQQIKDGKDMSENVIRILDAIDALYHHAIAAQNHLTVILDELCDSFPDIQQIKTSLKPPAKTISKAYQEYNCDVGRVLDISRCSMVCRNSARMQAVVSKLKDLRSENIKLIGIKNGFAMNNTYSNIRYRDLKLYLRAGAQHVVEMQLHLQDLYDVKGDKGYQLYRAANNNNVFCISDVQRIIEDKKHFLSQVAVWSARNFEELTTKDESKVECFVPEDDNNLRVSPNCWVPMLFFAALLGCVMELQGQRLCAEEWYRALIVELSRNEESLADSIVLTHALNRLAATLIAAKKLEEAKATLERALATSKRLHHGMQHPICAKTLFLLSQLHMKRREYSDAFANCDSAVAILASVHGPNFPGLGPLTCLRGLACVGLDNQIRCLESFKWSLRIYKTASLNGEHDIEISECMYQMAEAHNRMWLLPKAKSLYLQSLSISSKVLTLNHPLVSVAISRLKVVMKKEAFVRSFLGFIGFALLSTFISFAIYAAVLKRPVLEILLMSVLFLVFAILALAAASRYQIGVMNMRPWALGEGQHQRVWFVRWLRSLWVGFGNGEGAIGSTASGGSRRARHADLQNLLHERVADADDAASEAVGEWDCDKRRHEEGNIVGQEVGYDCRESKDDEVDEESTIQVHTNKITIGLVVAGGRFSELAQLDGAEDNAFEDTRSDSADDECAELLSARVDESELLDPSEVSDSPFLSIVVDITSALDPVQGAEAGGGGVGRWLRWSYHHIASIDWHSLTSFLMTFSIVPCLIGACFIVIFVDDRKWNWGF